jgi:hypothetical protein
MSLNAPGPIYLGLEGLAFVPPFIEGRGAFLSDQDLALFDIVGVRELELHRTSPQWVSVLLVSRCTMLVRWILTQAGTTDGTRDAARPRPPGSTPAQRNPQW